MHAVSRVRAAGVDGRVRWWNAEVSDTDAVHRLVQSVQPDLIFNLAGETRAARTLDLVLPTFRTNLAGTVNLLAAAAEFGCHKIVLTGSLEEPSDAWGEPPSSPYAASKLAGNAYGRMFHAIFEVPVVGLRVFMVYGPGQTELQKLVPHTILELLRGQAPKLSSGRREVDWVYVDDVVDAFIAAASVDAAVGHTLDIGSGELVSVRDVVERIARRVAPDRALRFGAVEDRPKEQVRAADTNAAEAILGWRPSTTLDVGLERTVAWYSRFVEREADAAQQTP